ncbi:hypothetical protein HJFPF1_04045 [Paramyrothecium foliicola]|nr:hypothetical protein HJFPF1_04045 [Paramyrothecium foliicola]
MASTGHTFTIEHCTPVSCSKGDERVLTSLATCSGVFPTLNVDETSIFNSWMTDQLDLNSIDLLLTSSPGIGDEGNGKVAGSDSENLTVRSSYSAQSGHVCRGMKWTSQLDSFLVQQRRIGDTYIVIAEKMRQQFGVSVNPNILGKRFKHIATFASKDTIINKALGNLTAQITNTVKDEVDRLSIDNANMLDEVNQEMLRRLPDILKDITVDLWIQSQIRRI